MDRIKNADSLLSSMADLEYNFIILCFEKLLSRLAVETATVR